MTAEEIFKIFEDVKKPCGSGGSSGRSGGDNGGGGSGNIDYLTGSLNIKVLDPDVATPIRFSFQPGSFQDPLRVYPNPTDRVEKELRAASTEMRNRLVDYERLADEMKSIKRVLERIKIATMIGVPLVTSGVVLLMNSDSWASLPLIVVGILITLTPVYLLLD